MSIFGRFSTPGLSFLAVCVAYSQTGPAVSFDVASVKPSANPAGRGAPGQRMGCSGGPGSADPGRWVCSSASLGTLITTAYKLRAYQFTPPDWMYQARFDIEAKIPPGSTAEQLRLMEQDLLATRFKLAVHFEPKGIPGYELTLGKDGRPKFQESVDDPPDYTAPSAPRTMDWDKTDGFPILPPGHETVLWFVNGHVSNRWRKVTMEELVAYLADQLKGPVDDATGLTGKYDVTLKFVAAAIPMPGTPMEIGPNGERIPPFVDTHPTLMEAVQSQLGLKLEKKPATASMMVVDHVEKVPTEN
jgi:uncharacterized protein (TIGR03435 family)